MIVENARPADLNSVTMVDPDIASTDDATIDDDASYGSAWDKVTAGNDDVAPVNDEIDVPAESDAASIPAAPQLPANMTAEMTDVFDGMAPEKAAKLNAWADKLHRQMSDQGRQISAMKPFSDVIGAYPEYFQQQGAPAPPDAFDRMMAVQKLLDQDPIAGLKQIADVYGISEQSFGGGLATETAQLRSVIADLRQQLQTVGSPDTIRTHVDQVFRERTATDEVSRFAQSKPLFSDVEAVLPEFVALARRQLGENATPSALLESAYDMAVNAMPETRAKQKAAAQAADTAGVKDQAAKRAASINIKGAPTGQRAYASEEEAMGAAFDRAISA